MKFFDKMRTKRWQARHRLTPSGACLRDYCKLICSGKWTRENYIEAYEEEIARAKDIWENSHNIMVEREDAAALLFDMLNNCREA